MLVVRIEFSWRESFLVPRAPSLESQEEAPRRFALKRVADVDVVGGNHQSVDHVLLLAVKSMRKHDWAPLINLDRAPVRIQDRPVVCVVSVVA